MTKYDRIEVVYEDPPGPNVGRTAQLFNHSGAPVGKATWQRRRDGKWLLVLDVLPDEVERGAVSA